MAFLLQEVHIADFKVFILCYRTMKLFILFVFGLQGQSASGCAPSCAFANKDELQATLISWWTGDASAKAGIEANYGPIRTWDVTQVTDMSSLFNRPELRDFDADIGGWDVSSVTRMTSMFFGASSFNQHLDSWDVSSVTRMNNMFFGASSFNQPLDSWDVSSVILMTSMFYQASSFDKPLDSWDVSSVTGMSSMFYQASSFNQPLDSWDVSSVNIMTSMFEEASSFNQPLKKWDVSSVTRMNAMFYQASSFNQPLGSWDVSSVTTMSSMFYQASSFNQPLDSWDVSSVTLMISMFYQASSFNQPLDSWDVSSVANMDSMFYQASPFSQCLASWQLAVPPSNEEMFFETQCAADAGNETLPNGLLDCGCKASRPWCEELDALDYGLLKKKGRQAVKNCLKKSLVKSLIGDNGLEPKLHWERGSGVADKLLLVGLVIGVLMTMVVSAAVVYRRRRTVPSYEELWEAPWGTALGARNAFVCAQDRFKSLRAKGRSFVILSICPSGGDVAFLKKESFMTAFLYPSVLILNSSEN